MQVTPHWLVAALVVERSRTSSAIARTRTVHAVGQRQRPGDLLLHATNDGLGLMPGALLAFRLGRRLQAGVPSPL